MSCINIHPFRMERQTLEFFIQEHANIQRILPQPSTFKSKGKDEWINMEQDSVTMCLWLFIDLIIYLTKLIETFYVFPEETFHLYNLLWSTKCTYLHEIYCFYFACFPQPLKALCQLPGASVVAPKNLDMRSRPTSLKHAWVPLGFFVSIYMALTF